MIALDASALLELLLGRPAALEAITALVVDRAHEPLHAPELIEPEVLNALRRLVRTAAVSELRAGEVVADLREVRMVRYPHAPLRERVWDLRDRLSAHDATYLALAEVLDEPMLITADAGLATQARASLGPGCVTQLEIG